MELDDPFDGRGRDSFESTFFCSSLLLSSLESSDAQVYEPYTRALLGIASHCCEVDVLKLRTVLQVHLLDLITPNLITFESSRTLSDPEDKQ